MIIRLMATAAVLAGVCGPAFAAEPVGKASLELLALRQQIAQERQVLDAQQRAIDAQRGRLQALENSMLAQLRGTGTGDAQVSALQSSDVPLPPSPPPGAPGSGSIQTVGEAPTNQRQVQVAVLSEQGGVITKRGRLTLESDLEYARADRNRVLFRGVAIPEAVLIGAFDINESRQDVLTAAIVARLGVTNRFEINARVPFIHRSDSSALAPVVNNGNSNGSIGTDRSVQNSNLGDIDFGVRYQFTDGQNGLPYLIGGVQAVARTGTDPFRVPRDSLGNPLQAATGSGFWGVTPTLTAILPSDPAVLFATFGYTVNFARAVNMQIGSAIVDRVSPGGEPSASLGIALSLNPRTSLSFGYAHTMAFGTKTVIRTIDPQTGSIGDPVRVKTRDLQLGRLLFGVSYRTSPSTTINWNVELGATDDATDIRTTLRIPFNFNLF